MKKFVYKFDSIRKVKQALEKKAQKEVALIDVEIKKAKQKIIDLNTEKKSYKEKIGGKKTIKAHEMHFQLEYEMEIDNKIVECQNELIELDKKRVEKVKELTEKTKETKMFDKLEEKHYENFIIEQNRIDQLETDDLATKKFIRNTKQ